MFLFIFILDKNNPMLTIVLEENEICSTNSRSSLSRRIKNKAEVAAAESSLIIGAAASSTSLVQGTNTVL